ncbi:MAG: FIST C-terminal domain-containing protein [Candidatus Spechtbacteria bacterium]|nr:FIST C-terminal domain-containing protein [Candidatus Spechtbacteria bacterium]
MIKAGVGLSQNIREHQKAGFDAAKQAIEKLDGQKPSILFAFSSVTYQQEEVLRGIRKAAPGAIVVGGSAAGEITSWITVFNAVNVLAIASDTVKFVTGIGTGVSKDSFQAGAMAAQAVIDSAKGEKPNLFIMLPDGMTGNGAAIVDGVKSVLGENAPIIGGSLGDDYLFKKTFEYHQDQVLSDVVVGVGLYGKFSYGFGIKHGWEPVGLPLKVTKADGVKLQEVDDKPALQIYEDYFGKDASELVKEPLARIAYTYPIGMIVEGSDELLIRDPVIANEKGEISMAAAIPQGTTIRLMIGDREKAIQAAKTASKVALEQLAGATPRFILMFNCMARNKLLGLRCHEENAIVSQVIGPSVPMAGFYTYGEQGPLLGKKGTPCYFHNETMTLLVVGE